MLLLEIEKRLGGFRLAMSFSIPEIAAPLPPVIVLFGPSGAGKSLTLQCIAGMITPDRGRIRLRDRTLFDPPAGVNLPCRHRRVGFVFQNHALFPHLTVAQNVGYGIHHLPRKERAGRIGEMLERTRLAGLEKRKPRELSGGQQQRVALARALAPRPDLLLLDEPFASLDTPLREELRQDLLLLLRELDVPAVLVTHDLDEAYLLGQEIVVCDAGQVLQYGPREEVYHRPGSRRVAELVGVKNLLPGTVVSLSVAGTEVAVPGFTLWGPAGDFAIGQPVVCCIRAEAIRVETGSGSAMEADGPLPPGAGTTRLTCRVLDHTSYGSRVALILRPHTPAAGAEAPRLHTLISAQEYRRLPTTAPEGCSVLLDAEAVHITPAPPDG
jgi:molybdate transport system ATP-binding protein